jgi:hypothetical protein
MRTNPEHQPSTRFAKHRRGVKTELVEIRAALDELAADVRAVIRIKSMQSQNEDRNERVQE